VQVALVHFTLAFPTQFEVQALEFGLDGHAAPLRQRLGLGQAHARGIHRMHLEPALGEENRVASLTFRQAQYPARRLQSRGHAGQKLVRMRAVDVLLGGVTLVPHDHFSPVIAAVPPLPYIGAPDSIL
jgi:hypothetical protein